jgi:hypothetical protein
MKFGDELLQQLDAMGETEVRTRLARGEYGSKGTRRDTVEQWLAARVQSRNDLSNREQIRIAHSAKNAAWIAAIAAIIAAICAIITVRFSP